MMYRRLLLLFPHPFRARFGGDMAEMFADRMRAAREQGLFAVLSFWARTVSDVIAHGIAERRAAARASSRAAGSTLMLDSLIQDVRYAFRTFRRRPGFTAVALVTLALGIGANTAIFSVVHAVLIRDLPYPDADRIVSVYEMYRRNFSRMVANPFNFDTWERRAHSFERLAAMRAASVTLTGAGESVVVFSQQVTPAFFEIMGGPAVGRALTHADADGPAVAVISAHLWRTRLGESANVLGSTITLDGVPAQIVGLMPETFRFPSRTDIWRPLGLTPTVRANMTSWFLGVVGRLKPGVTIDQAQAELDAISADLAAQFPKARQNRGAWVIKLHDDLVFRVSDSVVLLQLVAGFVLLVACANVANLLMVSASARRREISIRTAIGAGRARLIRQLMTESVLLSSAGAIAGVAIAIGGIRLLVAFAPGNTLPATAVVGINATVLAFTGAVAVLTGMLAGVAPAFISARGATSWTLKETGAAAGSGNRSQRWLRSALVGAEVALSLVLVAGSALLVQSFIRLNAQQTGFSRDGVLTGLVTLPRWRYKDPATISAFWRDLFDRLAHAPGVTLAAGSTALPFSNWEWQTWFEVEGRDAPQDNGSSIRTVTPGYFSALDIPLRGGRAFTAADTFAGEPVVIVNESFARRHITGNPIGQRLRTERPGSGPASTTLINAARPPEFTPRWMTIVGVTGDTRHVRLDWAAEPEIYRPLAQTSATTMMVIALRTERGGDGATLIPALRDSVSAIDRDVPIESLRTMDAAIDQTTAQRRFETGLMTLFASLAAVLAMVGIYGVMSYAVGLRTREVSIRLALGARPAQIKRLMVRQGLVPVVIGLAIGVVGAQYAGRLIEAQLFAVTRHDASTYAGAAAVFLIVAAIACWMPARRTSRVQPVSVLRSE